jgi:hypothetical protein
MGKLRKSLPPIELLNKSLETSGNSKEELRIDYSSPEFTFLTMWKLTDVIEALNNLTSGVTTARLFPNWMDLWQQFQITWTTFSNDFVLSFPCSGGRHLVSPKIHNILVLLPNYIHDHQYSLFRVHEQAFETFHQKFKAFEQTFSIPKVDWWVPPKKKSKSSTESIDEHAPSFSTRSGSQRKRQKRLSKSELADKSKEKLTRYLLSLAPDPISFDLDPTDSKESVEHPRRKRTNVQNMKKAQRARFRAVIAWNAGLFATSSRDRIQIGRNYANGDENAPWNREF